MTTHCDIGISPKVAAVLGTKPTIDYLCDDYSDGGSSIQQSDIDFDWILPAAVDCPKCIKVRDLWRGGMTLRQARKTVKKKSHIVKFEFGEGGDLSNMTTTIKTTYNPAIEQHKERK